MIKEASISNAPALLNTNDKAMWVLGFNEAVAKQRSCDTCTFMPESPFISPCNSCTKNELFADHWEQKQ